MFTIGCDPELFLKQGDKYMSSVGLIGGSKDFPRALSKDGYAILEDNVTVEFNIAPCHNHIEFIAAIQYAMAAIREVVPGYEFSQESAAIFDKDQLDSPGAQEFGCEPDFNAWTKTVNPRPCAVDASLRSAGGHVHIGHDQDPIEVIRAMDWFLGVPSTRLDTNGAQRRNLYGGAGSFRPKEYGCEYRTLSNFWIFKPELIEWVHKQTSKAVAFVTKGNKIKEKDGHIIQRIINNNSGESYELLSRTYGF
jgi:hypothetical protein